MNVQSSPSVTLSTKCNRGTAGRKGRRHDIVKPSMYKTSICTFYTSADGCPFGDYCAFAHGEHELRVQPEVDTSVVKEKTINAKETINDTITTNNNVYEKYTGKANELKEQYTIKEEKQSEHELEESQRKLKEREKILELFTLEKREEQNLGVKENCAIQLPFSVTLPLSSPETATTTPTPIVMAMEKPRCAVREYKVPVGLAQSPVNSINRKHPINTSTAITNFTNMTSAPFMTTSKSEAEHNKLTSSESALPLTSFTTTTTTATNRYNYTNSYPTFTLPFSNENIHTVHDAQQTNLCKRKLSNHYQQNPFHQESEQLRQHYHAKPNILNSASNMLSTSTQLQNKQNMNINSNNTTTTTTTTTTANNNNSNTNSHDNISQNHQCYANELNEIASLLPHTTAITTHNLENSFPAPFTSEQYYIRSSSVQKQLPSYFSVPHQSTLGVPEAAVSTSTPSESAAALIHKNSISNNINNCSNTVINGNCALLSPTSVSVLQPFTFAPSTYCPIVPIATANTNNATTTTTAAATSTAIAAPITPTPIFTPLPNSSIFTNLLPMPSQVPLTSSQLSMPAINVLNVNAPKLISDAMVYQIPINMNNWHNEPAGMWPSTAAAYYYLASQQQQQQQQLFFYPSSQQDIPTCEIKPDLQREKATDLFTNIDNLPNALIAEVNTFNDKEKIEEDNTNNVDHNALELYLPTHQYTSNTPLFSSPIDEADNDTFAAELGSE